MKTKISVIIALILLFEVKASGQEWEYPIPYNTSDSEMTRQYCAYGMSDGRIIVSASFLYNDGTNKGFYPPHNALVALSPDGEELARTDYFKPGYWGSSYNPYVFENENGELFALMSYSPDHNPDYFNYFLSYDDSPTDAILGLYKLGDGLAIEESYEHRFPVDTAQGQDSYNPCESSGGIHIHSAILDGGNIVGAYTKNVSKVNGGTNGNDSLFFFRMNFDGELLANVGYEIPYSGWAWQMIFWREQLVKTDYGYIYYNNRSNVPPAQSLTGKDRVVGGSVVYLDKDFNLLRIRHFKHPGTTSNPWTFDDVSIMRSRHNTTYLATRSNKNYEQGCDDCYLYEFDDDIDGTQEVVPVVNELHRGSSDFDFVAECRAVDVRDNFSLFFCYSLNVGVSLANDSWVMIEQLDNDFNTLREVYYGTDSDMTWDCAESITFANDGGILITAHTRKLADLSLWGSVVVKFPAEVFESTDEAHANGLSLAVAYPNPGNNVMNIRTTLQKSHINVYDLNGKLIHNQKISDVVTSIGTDNWPSGVYIWKVISEDGSEMESGKWVKE